MRALVAVEHSPLTAIWHMLTTTSPYLVPLKVLSIRFFSS
jgi:hypothetical protein